MNRVLTSTELETRSFRVTESSEKLLSHERKSEPSETNFPQKPESATLNELGLTLEDNTNEDRIQKSQDGNNDCDGDLTSNCNNALTMRVENVIEDDDDDDEREEKYVYQDYADVPPPTHGDAMWQPVLDLNLDGKKKGSRGSREPNFPVKLHTILSRPEFSDMICWMPHGRSWRVLRPKAFEERVIPLYFRHSQYSSFARQVNGWGFHRITQGPDYNSYYHELFLRGRIYLCKRMRRPHTSKKMTTISVDDEPNFYLMSEVHACGRADGAVDHGKTSTMGMDHSASFVEQHQMKGRSDFVQGYSGAPSYPNSDGNAGCNVSSFMGGNGYRSNNGMISYGRGGSNHRSVGAQMMGNVGMYHNPQLSNFNTPFINGPNMLPNMSNGSNMLPNRLQFSANGQMFMQMPGNQPVNNQHLFHNNLQAQRMYQHNMNRSREVSHPTKSFDHESAGALQHAGPV
mmetsp:Transcript_1553/g.2110  ORF Transcript_1553/g.2110 Transcript_1553/m.2110 type:complete len:458 (-) Transcript_1553:96-1469(-)|eukprot:CAMPEP_0116066030 /NCGR_PEP_ID=MMETSP0322-20121206/10133_1 /TAXON_ID=163516 /ORGANISM="Leptocylindrus danicus var. apora, Strain B651" /LENGTH=457 /DNA_ID=CAMNT_0003552493 /DNA_START=119 /DNA_END=1492 /DNA_ORIENTATION=+